MYPNDTPNAGVEPTPIVADDGLRQPPEAESALPNDGLNHETMSLHLALRELKTLSKRIASTMDGLKPCIAVAKNQTASERALMDMKDGLSDLTSIMDMIRRYDTIKSGIVLANVNTAVGANTVNTIPVTVTYGSKDMTLAEIIEKRGNYRSFISRLLTILERSYASAKQTAEQITRNAEATALQLVNAKTADKLDASQLEMYNNYVLDNQGVVVYCINNGDITVLIKQLQAELDKIDTDFDAALSVANATATIEIAYPVGKASL